MDQTLNGKVAAITGAASGIGLACARRLLAAGATVALVDRGEGQPRRALRRARAERPSRSRSTCSTRRASPRMVPAILERAGQLDIFHANAGTYIGGDLLDSDARGMGPDAGPQRQRGLPHRRRGACRT